MQSLSLTIVADFLSRSKLTDVVRAVMTYHDLREVSKTSGLKPLQVAAAKKELDYLLLAYFLVAGMYNAF